MVLVLGTVGQWESASSGAADPPLTAEQKERLKERKGYRQQALKLCKQGELLEAVAAVEKALAIERAVLGPLHEEMDLSLRILALIQEEREDFAASQKARRDVLSLRIKRYGEQHWQTVDARLELFHTDLLARLDDPPVPAGV
jgi:hypothetical protein